MSKVDKLKKEIEEKTGSCTFCILPWIHMSTEPNGLMRLCCASNSKGILSDIGSEKSGVYLNETTISEEWNKSYYKNIREQMLNHKEPINCQKCFQQEKIGIVSKRLWETQEWMKKGIDISNLNTKANSPVYLDLRFGNTCNLKCVMCSPHDSSQWVSDYTKLSNEVKNNVNWNNADSNRFWYRNNEFRSDLYSLIPNLQQVYFAGGEPLMIPEHLEFIEEIVNQGYNDNIELKYNTNGSFISEDLINIWKKFKRVKISVSLDGIFEKGEYIRFPMDWKQVYTNLKLLDNTPENISVNIAVTTQILNVKYLPDFAKWKIDQNFKKINLDYIEEYQIGAGIFNTHLLYIPTFLSIQVLPEQDKREVEEIFYNFKRWLEVNYNESFWSNPVGWQKWQSILDYMNKRDRSDQVPEFRKYISELDSIRGTNAKIIFPELSHLL